MPSPDAIAKHLESLLSDRQKHAEAIAAIDLTLARMAGVMIDGYSIKSVTVAAAAPKARGKRRRRRTRGKFATSANELILGFVKDHPGSTTSEIKQAWASEGRGGGADNALSLLVKAKKLKRKSLEGARGSSFTLP